MATTTSTPVTETDAALAERAVDEVAVDPNLTPAARLTAAQIADAAAQGITDRTPAETATLNIHRLTDEQIVAEVVAAEAALDVPAWLRAMRRLWVKRGYGQIGVEQPTQWEVSADFLAAVQLHLGEERNAMGEIYGPVGDGKAMFRRAVLAPRPA